MERTAVQLKRNFFIAWSADQSSVIETRSSSMLTMKVRALQLKRASLRWVDHR